MSRKGFSHAPFRAGAGLFVCLLTGCASKNDVPAVVKEYSIRFEMVTESGGFAAQRTSPNAAADGSGGGFLDYNRDNYLDVLVLDNTGEKGRSSLLFYRSEGGKRFVNATREAGLDGVENSTGFAVGDYDNDSYDDLLVTTADGARLFHNIPDNSGGRRFEDGTQGSGLAGRMASTAAVWFDYDGDGKLDLFLCHYAASSTTSGRGFSLYHNEGSGKFTDVTEQAGLKLRGGRVTGLLAADFDDDGKTDIFATNANGPNFLFHNNGNGTFTDIADKAGMANGADGKPGGRSADIAAIRPGGLLSLAVGSAQGLALYETSKTLPFTEKSALNHLRGSAPSQSVFGLAFGDFDNDSLTDLLVACGGTEPDGKDAAQPGLFFRNRGEVFEEAGGIAGPGVREPLAGRVVSVGDYDNDGKLDALLIPHGGAVRLLHNVTQAPGSWVTLRLEGRRSNRNALGATITLEAGGRKQTAVVRSSAGYLSSQDMRVHFGLGIVAKVDKVTVHWPGGDTQTWENIPLNRQMQLLEGTKEIY